jgi:hypothetical protein
MTSIILLAVFFGTAATIILIIYLIDRINRLERLTLDNNATVAERNPETPGENKFLGLAGKMLWDAMTGKSPDGFNDNDLIALKPRYEQLLRKHIERLFAEGVEDSQKGAPAKRPKVPATIGILRGSISSWIPPQHAATIYNTGYASVTAGDEESAGLRADLDESTGLLYSRTELKQQQPFSETLMPSADSSAEDLLDDLPNIDESPTPENDLPS